MRLAPRLVLTRATSSGSHRALLVRDVHLGKAARGSRAHRCDNLSNMMSDETPSPLTQHHNRNFAARQVLLVSEILVCRNRSRCPVVEKNQHQGRGAATSAVCAAN